MSAPAVLYHMQNSWIAQLDPQIPARSMDSCPKYGSIDCAARSMDCADPQIVPNIYTSCNCKIMLYITWHLNSSNYSVKRKHFLLGYFALISSHHCTRSISIYTRKINWYIFVMIQILNRVYCQVQTDNAPTPVVNTSQLQTPLHCHTWLNWHIMWIWWWLLLADNHL